jgi:hypothetical protein
MRYRVQDITQLILLVEILIKKLVQWSWLFKELVVVVCASYRVDPSEVSFLVIVLTECVPKELLKTVLNYLPVLSANLG